MNKRRLISHGFLAAVLSVSLCVPTLAQDAQGDPPARVGRIALINGTVSFHAANDSQWQAASVNFPMTSGNSLWTEPQATAAVDVGGSRIYLDHSTELDMGTIDERTFVASLAQGTIYVRAADASPQNGYEIDTPRAAVHIEQPGQYEIIAGDTDNPTRVVAFDGAAAVVGQGINTQVTRGEGVEISGQGPFTLANGAAQGDDFTQFAQNEEQRYSAARQAPAYVSPQETGYQDLARYGRWQQTPNYGPVWSPFQVAADWAPYRYGHWAYVVPWGWTWVDDAPWGFTPFHYGRWVEYDDRWAWVPGQVVAEPVYAPALVSFIGGFALGAAFGSSVGWIPLGPYEVYHPYYHASPRYVRNVNITNVRNETTIVNNINNTTVINNFANRNGATVVSADAMANSRHIAPEFRKIPRQQLNEELARAKPLGDVATVKPTLNTAGVTPTLGKRIGAAEPASGTTFAQRTAPGPDLGARNRNASSANQGGADQGGVDRLPPLEQGHGGTPGTLAHGTGGNGNVPALKTTSGANQGNGSASRSLSAAGAVSASKLTHNNGGDIAGGSGKLPPLKATNGTGHDIGNANANRTLGAPAAPSAVPTPKVAHGNGNSGTKTYGNGQLPPLKTTHGNVGQANRNSHQVNPQNASRPQEVMPGGNGNGNNPSLQHNAAPGPAIAPQGNNNRQPPPAKNNHSGENRRSNVQCAPGTNCRS